MLDLFAVHGDPHIHFLLTYYAKRTLLPIMSSSSTNMSELETKKKTSTSTIIPDWTLLPGELLHLISTHLHNCFDVVHARSVCCSWRSTFPFPSSLLRQSFSLPSFRAFSLESKDDLCTLEKVPLFLFRVPTSSARVSQYLLGQIGRNQSPDHKLLPSSLQSVQCSVKVKILESETLINTVDCQIIPLGHQYRMIGSESNRVAFLPLDKEGKRGEFVVLVGYVKALLVLTSAEMRWKRLQNVPGSSCMNIVTYRGRFYATFSSGEIIVIDPYSLEVTLMLLSQPLEREHYMVASSNDELFLVEVIIPTTCRVSRLDEEAGKWDAVNDLGDRVLFIGCLGYVSCSVKEFPHGCGLSGNSIWLKNESYNEISCYSLDDNLNGCWRYSRENSVKQIYSNRGFLALDHHSVFIRSKTVFSFYFRSRFCDV